jgi:adenylate cyclase
MTTQNLKRKLTAILSADVVGYSRLMGADDVRTIRILKRYKETITKLVQTFRGRVVDAPGDNMLAEFASVVDAVKCAAAVQKEIETRNNELSEDRKMRFRIGINLGDVIDEEGRIYGDGVNIAARIESLADPGGVSISRNVYNQVRNKLKFGFEFQGQHSVKNIAEPVNVYRVLMAPEDEGKIIDEKTPKSWRLAVASAAAVLILFLSGLTIYNYFLNRSPSLKEQPAKGLSIAVLPFDNMSNDPEQEYFSNGIAENLITDLSKIPDFTVIARTTSFAYKGKSLTIEQIAKELDVNFVLEGSVQRAGDKLRINAQLINASTGHHLWAERYDGNISDIFSLQDQITLKIASSLAFTLTDDEQARLTQHGTNSIEAYEAFLKGSDLANYLRMDSERMAKAIPWFEKAIELDPDYSDAYAGLAEAYMRGSILGIDRILGISLRLTRMRAANYLKIAIKNPTHLAYREMARLYVQRRQFEEALKYAEKAITIDPNNADNNSMMAQALIWSGSPDEAIPFLERMRRTDPACLF